jgi:UDP-N-acetylglucosamine:LPS N-acetylglucosamine transferase
VQARTAAASAVAYLPSALPNAVPTGAPVRREVRTLDAVLWRLSQGNDLGKQPLHFMVGSGSYTAQLAAQRGLCKPAQCDMFAQLNPY